MSGSFSVPSDFTDDPTEAPFPRQLIIYDEDEDTWSPTIDKDTIKSTRYLCVSYRQSDFPSADRHTLERDVQTVCQQFELTAYWLDYACTGSTQEEKNMDLYRIADVFRGSTKTLIMLKGGNIKPHSQGWLSWGDRLWTLPEALLSGYHGDKIIYKAGTKPVKPITLREIANHAYKSGDKEMSLMNAYSGEPVLSSRNMFGTLVKAIWNRSSGPAEGKEKGAFTAYDAERVYALMGFMPRRIRPDPRKSEKQAFDDLMQANGSDMDLDTILNSAEGDAFSIEPRMPPMESEQMKILDKIPYAKGMRYKKENCCLPETRVRFLDKIKSYLENKDEKYSKTRVFLLTGVAGSGKSTIAHSIALHYDTSKQLMSSFFFSVDKAADSKAFCLLRNVARDIAGKSQDVQRNLVKVVKGNEGLSTTESITDQYERFLQEPLGGVNIESPAVIVIDALDECEAANEREERALEVLEKFFAEGLSALPSYIRVFLTARAGTSVHKSISSQLIETLTMDEIDSNREDIQTFFHHELSHIAEELTTVDTNWLPNLTQLAGNLFIYAEIACRYILKKEFRLPKEKLQNLLSLQEEPDRNSPIRYLYKLYTEVLDNTVDKRNLSDNNFKSIRERLKRVLGMVLMAYEQLSSNSIDELLGPNDDGTGMIRQMGTLLNGVSNPEAPVQLLHASFGDFLRDKEFNETYYVSSPKQHGVMAMKCLELMNENLKFNMLELDDVSVVNTEYDNVDEELRKHSISEALLYACRYWLVHVTQMSKDELDLIQQPMDCFLFERKHLMRWIEVISDMNRTSEASDALLSLYNWLMEVSYIGERTPKLIWECYHLLRCFKEPIASAPLQVYLSALPYAPPTSLLHDLYIGQSLLPPKTLIGGFKDLRLFSSSLGDVRTAAFSRDGNRVAIIQGGEKLMIYNMATLSLISEPIEINTKYSMLAFSPDGCKIVLAGAKIYEVWSLNEHRILLPECDTEAKVIAVAFPYNDKFSYFTRTGKIIKVHERDLSQEREDTRNFDVGEQILCMAMSPDASHVGSISKLNKLSVWKTRDQRKVVNNVFLKNTKSQGKFEVLCISCDGEYIACGTDSGTIKLWNARKASFVWSREANLCIRQIVMPLSLENMQLLTVSDNGLDHVPGEEDIHVWDMRSGSCYEHVSRSEIAAISPDGRFLVTLGSDKSGQGAVRAIEANLEEPGAIKINISPEERIEEVVFLPDGGLLAWGRGAKAGAIIVWENLGAADATRRNLEGNTSWISRIRFSQDRRRLACLDKTYHKFYFWCRDGDDVNFSFRGMFDLKCKGAPEDAVFSPDESIYVAGSRGKNIVIFNFESRNVREQVLEGHQSSVWNLQFSADGRRLISGDENHTFLWCQKGSGVKFRLLEKYEGLKWDDAARRIDKLARTGSQENDVSTEGLLGTVEDNEDEDGQIQDTDGFLRREGDWVCLKNGRKVWYIPNIFPITHWFPDKVAQSGQRLVVYNRRFAILFEYKEDVVRAIFNT